MITCSQLMAAKETADELAHVETRKSKWPPTPRHSRSRSHIGTAGATAAGIPHKCRKYI